MNNLKRTIFCMYLLWWFRVPSTQLQKDGQVVAADNTISIRIYFQSPAKSVAVQRRWIHWICFTLQLSEAVHYESTATVSWYNFTNKKKKRIIISLCQRLKRHYLWKSAGTGAVTKLVIGFFRMLWIILESSELFVISSDLVQVWSWCSISWSKCSNCSVS